MANWTETGKRAYRSWMTYIRTHVGRGWRIVVGLLLIVGGVFGFLPVLGFWMIPLGIAVVLLDLRLYWRWLRLRTARSQHDDEPGPPA